jgi:hypothetical protein
MHPVTRKKREFCLQTAQFLAQRVAELFDVRRHAFFTGHPMPRLRNDGLFASQKSGVAGVLALGSGHSPDNSI